MFAVLLLSDENAGFKLTLCFACLPCSHTPYHIYTHHVIHNHTARRIPHISLIDAGGFRINCSGIKSCQRGGEGHSLMWNQVGRPEGKDSIMHVFASFWFFHGGLTLYPYFHMACFSVERFGIFYKLPNDFLLERRATSGRPQSHHILLLFSVPNPFFPDRHFSPVVLLIIGWH